MKKLLAILASLVVVSPAMADPLIERWKTPNAMGCMILRECKDGVRELQGLGDISNEYRNSFYSTYQGEISSLFNSLNELGVKVYLADEKYFPYGHRGVYSTAENNIYLNDSYMSDPDIFMEVLRHEGWHAAQDIMAGTIDNNQMAIIMLPELIPNEYVLSTDIAYAGNPAVLPWEREAKWAGKTEWMTARALEAATRGPIWEAYTPTPMTGEWLIENGFWDGN